MRIIIKNKYAALFAAALFSFYNVMQLSVFNVITSDLLRDFHLSTSAMGTFSGYDLWANALGLIPVGYLLDRWSVRKVGIMFLLIAILSCFTLAFSTSLILSSVARFGQGLASAASLLISMRLATTLFKDQAGMMVGIVSASALSGGIFTNSVFVYINQILGWRLGLTMLGFAGIGILLIMFFCLNIKKQTINHNKIENFQFTAVMKQQNIIAGIYLGLMSAPLFILATLWGNYYLINIHHLSSNQAGNCSSLFFVGFIISSACWGWLVDKYLSMWYVLYTSCLLVLILSVILFAYHALSPMQLALLFFGLGVFSSSQCLAFVYIRLHISMTMVSSATAIAALFTNGIGALLQMIYGRLLQQTSNLFFLPSLLFPAAFLICIVLLCYMQWYSKHHVRNNLVFEFN